MRSLGRLGLALSMAGLATGASAAPDSRTPLPADDWNAAQMDRAVPMQPDNSPPQRGGWGRDGWSDTIGAEAGQRRFDDRRADDTEVDRRPSGGRAMSDPDMRRVEAPGEWRRETWDGGRGASYAYRRGGRLPSIFGSSDYAIPDWQAYGLTPPGPRRRWVRYYDDAVLIDSGGTVIDAVPAIDWDDRGSGVGGGWHGGDGMAGYPAPIIDHRGPGPAPQVRYGPDGAMTIVITTAPSVATTTTTTTTSYTTARKRAWRAAPRRRMQTNTGR